MKIIVPLFLLALAACSSMNARETAREECSAKGLAPGTADYLNCHEQTLREIQYREVMQRPINPVPAPSPPPTMPPTLFRF